MKYNILICGAGQLGSRYLQGIAKLKYNYCLFVYDISAKSIKRASKRWDDVKKNKFFVNIYFIKSLNLVPQKIDFVIVSSISSVRANIIKKVISNTFVKYWILEKVLAQNENQIRLIESLIKNSEGAWVNTPRREMKWYQEIKSKIIKNEMIKVEINGGKWGLLSNTIHFIDLISWFTNNDLIEIDSSLLNGNWFESKRPGFYETYGCISCTFENGSTINICCDDNDAPLIINIHEKKYSWKIIESEGNATRSDGLIIKGNIEMQSEITHKIISKIIEKGDCSLPKLNQSASMHYIYLNSIIDFNNNSNKLVPIT